MKKLLRVAAALAAVFLLPVPAFAADAWVAPSPQSAAVGQSIVSINEISDGNWNTRREAIKWGADYAHSEAYVCHDVPMTGPCDLAKSGFSFYGSNLLVPCESAQQEDCIETLTFTTADGKTVTAHHVGNAGGPIFDAIPSVSLQKGGQVSFWQADGVKNSAGTDTYAVVIRSRQDWMPSMQRFFTISLDASVIPYRVQTGNYEAPYEKGFKNALGINQVAGFGHDGNCVWTDAGLCGVRADFVGNPKVSVKFRGSTDLGGWFRGRLAHTGIDITAFSKTNNLYTVTGEPVSVGRFAVLATAENTSERVKALFPVGSGGSGNELFQGNSGKFAFATDGSTGGPYTIIEDYRNAVHDTAAGTSSLWSFESISENSNNACLSERGRVLGIVTTDATAYDGVAPTFADGQLTYRVAGLHYMPDGKTLTDGTYDLVMRSDVARCLYKFSKAPISATVSVIDDKGESKTAVTTVNETPDGWLHLGAYGFTFSSPKINVKLSQEGSAVGSTPASSPAASTTITCVKGKLTKKVTGTAPKCPAGYKKK